MATTESIVAILEELGMVVPSNWPQLTTPESGRLVVYPLDGQQFATLLAILVRAGESKVRLENNTLSVRMPLRQGRGQLELLVYMQMLPGGSFQAIFNLLE